MDTILPHAHLPQHQYIEDTAYFFIVDTNRHVGTFEDEDLAAAMTGCYVSENAREEAKAIALRFRQTFPEAYMWIKEALRECSDEEFGQPCIVQAFQTPGWINDGKGTLFREHQAPPVDTMYLHRPWYAYLSVRLTFDRPLLPDEMLFLCQRAQAYAEETHQFEIEQFRLLHTETIITCLEVRTPGGTPLPTPAANQNDQTPHEA